MRMATTSAFPRSSKDCCSVCRRVIMAGTIAAVRAAQQATRTVPIVMTGGYPVPVTRPGWAYSMAAAAQCAAPTPKRYQRRRPERTLFADVVENLLHGAGIVDKGDDAHLGMADRALQRWDWSARPTPKIEFDQCIAW